MKRSSYRQKKKFSRRRISRRVVKPRFRTIVTTKYLNMHEEAFDLKGQGTNPTMFYAFSPLKLIGNLNSDRVIFGMASEYKRCVPHSALCIVDQFSVRRVMIKASVDPTSALVTPDDHNINSYLPLPIDPVHKALNYAFVDEQTVDYQKDHPCMRTLKLNRNARITFRCKPRNIKSTDVANLGYTFGYLAKTFTTNDSPQYDKKIIIAPAKTAKPAEADKFIYRTYLNFRVRAYYRVKFSDRKIDCTS